MKLKGGKSAIVRASELCSSWEFAALEVQKRGRRAQFRNVVKKPLTLFD